MKKIIKWLKLNWFKLILAISALLIAIAYFSNWYIRYDCSKYATGKYEGEEKIKYLQKCFIYNNWTENDVKVINKVRDAVKEIDEIKE